MTINVDDLVEDMPRDHMFCAAFRAAERAKQEGIRGDLEALSNDKRFREIFNEEIRLTIAQDLIDDLMDEGLVGPVNIKDGELYYRARV